VSDDRSNVVKLVREQKVNELMTRHVITLGSNDSILRAQNEMLRYRIKKIVVVAQSEKFAEKIPVGILTVKDILKFLLQDSTNRSLYEMRISEAMTTNLVTATQNESIANCASIMLTHRNNISSIVIVKEQSGFLTDNTQPHVMDAKMSLAGILTMTDLSRFYSENCSGLSSVSNYMSMPIITISINEKVRAAAELMVDKNVSLVGVTSNDRYKTLLGILSETEIGRVTLAFRSKAQRSVSEYIGMIFSQNKKHFEEFSEPSLVTIGDIFTPNPTLIEKGADLAEAAKILASSNNVSGLPVVESLQHQIKGNPPAVGIISKSDIVRALAEIK
jgi:CBS domain-containing protein